MSKLLFDLRHVPDDEADEVRSLLSEQGIEFYETRPSAWGLFAGGIWVTSDEVIDRARQLLAGYQQQRQLRARAEYAQALSEGRAPGFWSMLRAEPLKVVGWLLAIVFLIGLTLAPFLLLAPAAQID